MKAHFLKMYDYEAWANALIIKACLDLDPMPEKISAIFSHLLAAQKVWYQRLTQGKTTQVVWPAISPEAWLSTSQTHAQAFKDFIQSLPEEDFQKSIAYQNSKGHSFETPILEIISHVLMHSSYHRGQVIQFIKPLVEVLPQSDFIFYVREKNK